MKCRHPLLGKAELHSDNQRKLRQLHSLVLRLTKDNEKVKQIMESITEGQLMVMPENTDEGYYEGYRWRSGTCLIVSSFETKRPRQYSTSPPSHLNMLVLRASTAKRTWNQNVWNDICGLRQEPFLQEGIRENSQTFSALSLFVRLLALSKSYRDDGLADTMKKENSFQIRNDAKQLIMKSGMSQKIWGVSSLDFENYLAGNQMIKRPLHPHNMAL